MDKNKQIELLINLKMSRILNIELHLVEHKNLIVILLTQLYLEV